MKNKFIHKEEEIDFDDVIAGFEWQIKNLKEQVKALKEFGEMQVQLNTALSNELRCLKQGIIIKQKNLSA